MEQPQLLFRIVDGPHKGTRAPIREGLTVGRKEGDLILTDPKMSVQHARVEWRDNEWTLIDLGSSNKIKVEGQRYAEVVLYPGLQLTIGSTTFEILENPKAGRAVERAPEAESPDRFEFTGSIEVQVEELSWREILSGLVAKAQKAEGPRTPAVIRPFPRTIRLEFISGVQHGTVWHLGYGPRTAGAASFDLPLFDDAAAESCFILDSAAGKVFLKAADGAILRLNGRVATTESTELRPGDRIEFGKTRIRVLMV